MTKDQFTLEQRELLLQANKIISDASINYSDILEQHVQALKKSLDSENLIEAVKICYRIQSQAGTFGWPLATEISGWFKRLLMPQIEKGVNAKVNTLFLDSLNIILKDKLKSESNTAVNLLLHMEAELKKQDIR